MDRDAAIVEFFRARVAESPDDADLRLLERYDFCVALGGCPGNEALDVARSEYEDHVFPARLARFAHHPAHAPLIADRWVYDDYVKALEAEPARDAEEEVTLDEDWDVHLRDGEDWKARFQGAVLITGGDCCCGGRHRREYTPAKARRIAAHLTALAVEAEKVKPARLLTPAEIDAL